MRDTSTQLLNEHAPGWLRLAAVLLFLFSSLPHLLAQNGAVTATQSFSYTGQIVTYTVPTGVTSLTIEARGAEGGDISDRKVAAGRGAIIAAQVSVSPGQALNILVGQQISGKAAGGGGTFVVSPSNSAVPTPVVIAGGGGGAGLYVASDDRHGQAGPSGGAGSGEGAGSGGSNGSGGISVNGGGGGGGFTGDGIGYGGGKAYVNGGAGGTSNSSGGYGGGGGAYYNYGGGGGYSGGGGGSTYNSGGGGGSFNAGTRLFARTGDTDGNSGNGLVIISYTTYPIRYVKQDGTGDGSSWANASGDLQAMIDASQVQQVWVARGRYTRTGGGSFAMKNNVAIYGGFAGSETSLSQRPVVNPVTGSPSASTLTTTSTSQAVVNNNGNALTNSAVLDGFVITGGNNGNGAGGIHILNGSPTLTNLQVIQNQARFGGGLFNEVSSPIISNCVFSQNQSTLQGGGIYNDRSNPSLTNCLISGNSSSIGGGIYNDRGNPSFINCVLSGNSSGAGGGMRSVNSSRPTLFNCTLTANRSSGLGAAFNNVDSQLQLTNCILWDNRESNSIYNDNSAVTANYCLIEIGESDYTGSNNLVATTSPFVSATNYQLNQCSIAINAGDPNSNATTSGSTDLAGNPRFYNNGRVDIGAYEYQGDATTPLVITQQPPASRTQPSGSTVSVQVTVSGSNPAYQWYKNSLNSPVPNQTSATLTIPNAQTADSGSYSVIVTNACYSVTSTAFTLTVDPPATPRPMLSTPTDGATTSGQPTFTGTAPAGSSVTVQVQDQTNNTVRTLNTTASSPGGSFSVQLPTNQALPNGTYFAFAQAQLPGQSISSSSRNRFTVDNTAPIVTLSASVSNGATTMSQPTSFTATFSKPVTGFTSSGISVSNGTVSGFMASGNGTSYSFAVTASSPGQVSVSVPAGAAQDGVGNPNTASASYGFTVTPGDFAIRAVDTQKCQLVDASRGEYRVSFTPVYSGLNGSPVSLRVINEVDATTAPGPYTIRLYADNPTVTLLARQTDSPDARFSYAWLAACQGSVAPNRPPTTTGIPPQQLVQNQPYQLDLTRYFADPDGQTLTYSSSDLPAGLTLTGTTISGSPTTPGRTTVHITAIDPGGLSVATDVAMQVDAPTTTTPPAGFTITGVTDLSCVAVTATERRVSFSPVYSGLDGSPVRFRVVNEIDATTAPGPYTIRLYTDNPAITLEAVQTGQIATYRYNWLSGCGSQTPPTATPRPPVVAVPIAPQSATVGQGYSFYVPANTFADPDGQPLTLRTGPLPAGLSFSPSLSAITGTPAQAGTSTIQLTASDPAGQSVSLSFTLQVMAGATTPPAPPAGFAITGVGSVTCVRVSSTERRLSFFPQYTGVNGSPIHFRVVNEQDFGTAPGPYSVRLYTDNPAVTLEAVQSGQTATYRYNWLADCPVSSRRGATEPEATLQVVVLGNPVVGASVELAISGAQGQPLQLQLVDLLGRLVYQQEVPQPGSTERLSLPLGESRGQLLLRVSTPTQQQQQTLLRP